MLETTTKGKIIQQMFILTHKINTRLISDLIIEYEFDYEGT